MGNYEPERLEDGTIIQGTVAKSGLNAGLLTPSSLIHRAPPRWAPSRPYRMFDVPCPSEAGFGLPWALLSLEIHEVCALARRLAA